MKTQKTTKTGKTEKKTENAEFKQQQNEVLVNSIKPTIGELERFYCFLNKRFDLKLPDEIVITIQTKGRQKRVLGWFAKERWMNCKGSVSEINICAEDLKGTGDNNPYETVAHEIAHYSNWKNGIVDCTGNNRHNKKFKSLAEKLLLEVTASTTYGFAHTKPTPAFDEMVKTEFKPQEGVFNIFRNLESGKKKQKTKMKKWVCGCAKPTIVRCATELQAHCDCCDKKFHLEGGETEDEEEQ